MPQLPAFAKIEPGDLLSEHDRRRIEQAMTASHFDSRQELADETGLSHGVLNQVLGRTRAVPQKYADVFNWLLKVYQNQHGQVPEVLDERPHYEAAA